jgi:gluconolactonase
MITANGCGLSPDGQTLYASETETGRVWAWPIIAPGQVAKEPWPSPNGGRFIGHGTGYARFDSRAIEENGNICVATLVNAGVSVFAPEGGLIEFYEAPEPYCTNIAFGGDDMKTAYITLSGYGTLIAVDWPRPGLKLAY